MKDKISGTGLHYASIGEHSVRMMKNKTEYWEPLPEKEQ